MTPRGSYAEEQIQVSRHHGRPETSTFQEPALSILTFRKESRIRTRVAGVKMPLTRRT